MQLPLPDPSGLNVLRLSGAEKSLYQYSSNTCQKNLGEGKLLEIPPETPAALFLGNTSNKTMLSILNEYVAGSIIPAQGIRACQFRMCRMPGGFRFRVLS